MRGASEKRRPRSTAGSRRQPSRPGRQITSFDEYQRVVESTDEKKQRVISLLGLVGEIGDLHSAIKKLLIQKQSASFRRELREEFGDVLWYLTSLAALYEIPLGEIATANAEKAQSLYSLGVVSGFDAKFPADERLPRKFLATFFEKPLNHGIYVKISMNGVTLGDALTDNAKKDDGYRYHDVFHLAYAAVLGWSPVTRALLKCKRKSSARVDEVEDGARAAIVEEAVSILVFNHAEERGWYAERASIDMGLLKTIRRMVSGLEVGGCTAKQWQSAIHQGYAVFDGLRRNGGGNVEVDLDHQKIVYRGSPSKSSR